MIKHIAYLLLNSIISTKDLVIPKSTAAKTGGHLVNQDILNILETILHCIPH